MKNQLAAREVDDSILRLPETDNIIECSTQRKNKSPTYTLGSSEAIKINAVQRKQYKHPTLPSQTSDRRGLPTGRY